ncbi:hypothetical protein V8C35DRAFT_229815 [Trichoderma chlorosporum]
MSSSSPAKVERRKIRRGTTSCWECKRRKTRCDFEQRSSSACVSCKRRGCKCILQHIEDQILDTEEEGRSTRNPDVGEQMDHLEGLVDELVRQTTVPGASSSDSGSILQQQHLPRENQSHASFNGNANRNGSAQQAQQLQGSSKPQRRLLPRPEKASAKNSVSSLDNRQRSESQISRRYPSFQEMLVGTPSLSPDPTSGSPRCSSLTLLLQSILPSVSVTTRIMHHNKPLMMSMHVFRGLSTDPFRSAPFRQMARPKSSAPAPAPKPIDLARSLFQLAICLQQSERTPDIAELCLDRSNSDVAGQYFEAASRYVTSQDSLVVSSEGIETLMLEGLYHVSTGQLRPAWLVFRRALGIAHLMGLHIPQRRRQNKQPNSTNLQASMCLATLWFRLIFMDRYLSLVLCLPVSVRDDSFMEDLVPKEPHEKLERTQALLTGRIISRNEQLQHGRLPNGSIYDHHTETKDIDYQLKQAARTLSADWWASPRLKDAHNNAELKDMTAKVVSQLHHYNLVLLLHLPYILPRAEDCFVTEAMPDYTNSRISAMFASRELITRSIHPVGPSRAPSSSRGNSLKMLLSASTLLLSHLDSHRLGRENAFDHHRPGDLLVVERAINSLDAVSHKYDDALCVSAVRALKKLSAIEASAADGVGYRAWSESSEVMQTECVVREEADNVEMLIPYLGTIRIQRQDTAEAASTNILRSHVAAAESNTLDGGILTPSWAWGDSPLSLLPELASTASSIDGGQDAFQILLPSTHVIQDTWNHQGGESECLESLPAPQRLLQNLDFMDAV